MKRLWLAAIVACGPASATRVELPQPMPPAPVAVERATLAEPMPDDAAPIRTSGDGAWVRAFPKEPSFRAYEAAGAARLLLTWRIGPEHFVEAVKGGDYPVNHQSAVDLVVRASGRDVVVPLGELPGTPTPNGVSYCKNRGYRIDADGGWSFPQEPSVGAAFTMNMTQGSDDFVLVRDGGTLHVLHRITSDGRCDEGKQGPLAVCEGFEYARRAAIHVGGADAFEDIRDDGEPFDCFAPYYGERLVFP